MISHHSVADPVSTGQAVRDKVYHCPNPTWDRGASSAAFWHTHRICCSWECWHAQYNSANSRHGFNASSSCARAHPIST